MGSRRRPVAELALVEKVSASYAGRAAPHFKGRSVCLSASVFQGAAFPMSESGWGDEAV